MRLLVVEDSASLRFSLERGLQKLGYAVDVAVDGVQGLSLANCEPYDLIVLDRMLPGMDGLDVLDQLRAQGKFTPVLMLTARDSIEDRVEGLQRGADDYLVKPFAFPELTARIDALLRRRSGELRPLITLGALEIDTRARQVRFAAQAVELSAREYTLLLFLSRRAGEIVSRIELEDHLYGRDNFPMSNALPVAISVLRSKLAEAGGKNVIHTHRGLGYRLQVEPEA